MAQVAIATFSPSTITSPLKLRELGIYKLDGGREFIVSTLYHDGCCLYSAGAWQTFGNAEFWVEPNGQLFKNGIPTHWRVENLMDTGRTSQYPRATDFIR
ncbi:MAG: hypothetical protein ACRD9R_05930 [Pyrinomonadaceae bacterium]